MDCAELIASAEEVKQVCENIDELYKSSMLLFRLIGRSKQITICKVDLIARIYCITLVLRSHVKSIVETGNFPDSDLARRINKMLANTAFSSFIESLAPQQPGGFPGLPIPKDVTDWAVQSEREVGKFSPFFDDALLGDFMNHTESRSVERLNLSRELNLPFGWIGWYVWRDCFQDKVEDLEDSGTLWNEMKLKIAAADAQLPGIYPINRLEEVVDMVWLHFARIVRVPVKLIPYLWINNVVDVLSERARDLRRTAEAKSDETGKIETNQAPGPAAPSDNTGEGKESVEMQSADQPPGWFGGAELAQALGIDDSQRCNFEQALSRNRGNWPDDHWTEFPNPLPNSPKYLYRVDTLQMQALARKYREPKQA